MAQRYFDSDILKTISYKVRYPYMGSLTAHGLSDAYHHYYRSEMMDPVYLYIGNIDGNVICNALWREMSYNPVRFGATSPFMYRGRNNIYAFCSFNTNIFPAAFKIMQYVRHNLIAFMSMNASPNGQWNAVINTRDGIVEIGNNKNYAMLAKLRECVKIIALQNVSDYKDKNGPYRDGIIQALGKSDSYTECDEPQDKQMEFLETITPEHGAELYQQAREELDRMRRDAREFSK